MSARMSVVFVAPTLQQFLHPDDARDSDVFLYEDEAEAADEATLPDAPASSGQIADGFKSGAFYEARFFAERATDRLLTHSDVFFIWCVCVLSLFWCL